MTRDAVLRLFDQLNVWRHTDDTSPWMVDNPREAYGDHRTFWGQFLDSLMSKVKNVG